MHWLISFPCAPTEYCGGRPPHWGRSARQRPTVRIVRLDWLGFPRNCLPSVKGKSSLLLSLDSPFHMVKATVVICRVPFCLNVSKPPFDPACYAIRSCCPANLVQHKITGSTFLESREAAEIVSQCELHLAMQFDNSAGSSQAAQGNPGFFQRDAPIISSPPFLPPQQWIALLSDKGIIQGRNHSRNFNCHSFVRRGSQLAADGAGSEPAAWVCGLSKPCRKLSSQPCTKLSCRFQLLIQDWTWLFCAQLFQNSEDLCTAPWFRCFLDLVRNGSEPPRFSPLACLGYFVRMRPCGHERKRWHWSIPNVHLTDRIKNKIASAHPYQAKRHLDLLTDSWPESRPSAPVLSQEAVDVKETCKSLWKNHEQGCHVSKPDFQKPSWDSSSFQEFFPYQEGSPNSPWFIVGDSPSKVKDNTYCFQNIWRLLCWPSQGYAQTFKLLNNLVPSQNHILNTRADDWDVVYINSSHCLCEGRRWKSITHLCERSLKLSCRDMCHSLICQEQGPAPSHAESSENRV